MKSDPKAPASSPLHIKNLAAPGAPALHPLDEVEHEFLADLHVTAAERDADQLPDATELDRRDQLIREYRQELEQAGETAGQDGGTVVPPTLEDETGALYVWDRDENGDFDWRPAPDDADTDTEVEEKADASTEPADTGKPAKGKRRRRSTGEDELAQALAALEKE